MIEVFLGLGSNIRPHENLKSGIQELKRRFIDLEMSPVYQASAVGFKGDDFFNLVCRFVTEVSLAQLASDFRELEFAYGRPEQASKFSARSLDIDILLYGELTGVVNGLQLPRAEILENAFVLRPLADLAPKSIHPTEGRSFAELWNDFAQDETKGLGQRLCLAEQQGF